MATTAPTKRPSLGRSVRANLPTAELYEDAVRHGEGLLAAEGPLVVRTGKHTGRSPEDKFIVVIDENAHRDVHGTARFRTFDVHRTARFDRAHPGCLPA